jgi:hypothetical protein
MVSIVCELKTVLIDSSNEIEAKFNNPRARTHSLLVRAFYPISTVVSMLNNFDAMWNDFLNSNEVIQNMF